MPARAPRLYLSPLQEEVLDGCLLGDGCIAIRKDRSPSPRFQWGCIHEDLSQFIADSFFPLSMRLTRRENAGGFYTDKPLYTVYSPTSVTFEIQRARWYREEKIVPFDLTLTRTSCLFWYMGDGGLSRDRVSLSVQGFSWGDVEVVLLPALRKIGFRSSVAYSERGKPRIYMNVVDSENWLRFIGPPPVPSMIYKWETAKSYKDVSVREDGSLRRKFSDDEKIDICRLSMQGFDPLYISELYECSRNTIAAMTQRWRNYAPLD